MSGASGETRRVNYINANWTAGSESRSPSFELMIVTEDDLRHALSVPNDQVAGMVALIQAASVLLWDPEGETLIAANLVGEWIPTSYSSLSGT